jgi:hypothetical protein
MPPLRRGVTFALAALIWLSVFVGIELMRPPSARAALPPSVSEPIRLADQALARAETRIANHRYVRALRCLETLRINVRRANNAAIAQIGLPPVDPESDDPPGPDSVFAALGLDHRVGMRLVLLFDGLTRADVVDSLRTTLFRAHERRDTMLDAIIALPAEGARGDYDDRMSDTLTVYPAEVNRITTALMQYELTAPARTGLVNARERVLATEAKVTAVWGGGE